MEDDADVKQENSQVSNATSEATLASQRSLPKSKRWWKKTQQNRPMPSNTKPKSGWEKKMKEKSLRTQTRSLQTEIRQKLADEKAQRAEAKKEKEKRRKDNLLKSEVVQVIKNPAKLKRMKKKQLKMIKTRDITTTGTGP